MDFKETAEAISLHGLGFIQVKLQAKQRLHVWHPDLPRRDCFEHSQIHDHRFAFQSLVLVGEQINRDYAFKEDTDEQPCTHISYLHEGERTAFGNRPWIPTDRLYVWQLLERCVPAGEVYHMDAYQFHSTEPGGDGRVATLMTKLFEGDRGARSLCTYGVKPHADFNRKQLPAADLWWFVADVLGNADKIAA